MNTIDGPTLPHPVTAVVSLFNPDAGVLSLIDALRETGAHVIAVDDGSGPGAHATLARLEGLGVDLVRLPDNQGIAAALNAGIARIQSTDQFVLFLDQDSALPEGAVQKLAAALQDARGADTRVAGSAPEWFADVQQADGTTAGGLATASRPIQSGLMMPREIIHRLGPLREDLFIDLVDDEYTLRARSNGYAFVIAPGLALPHRLGRLVNVSIAGFRLRRPGHPRIEFTVSTPWRYYYRSRNRVIINREYRRAFRAELWRLTLLELRHYAIVISAVRGRMRMLRVLLRGWRDGRRARTGRIPADIAALAAGITWRHPVEDR